jgi:type 1 glutamine amidotransferase
LGGSVGVLLLASVWAQSESACPAGDRAIDVAIAEPPKRVLLLGQKPDGHPPGTHEYMSGQRVLAKCLAEVKEIECTVVQADDPWSEGAALLRRADAVVLFVSEGARWVQGDPQRLDAFTDLARRGGGLVVLHWGMGTRDAKHIDGFLSLFGGCHGGPDRKFQVLQDAEVRVADREHPVARGIANFRIQDEFYYRLKFVNPPTSVQTVLQVPIDGQLETVAWSWERPDGGRSFGFSGLHFHENWRREQYRRLVAQAVLWTLQLPIPEGGLAVAPADGGH